MANDQRHTVAKVYAQALFELAAENDWIDPVARELESLSDVIRDDHRFDVFLSTPAIHKDRKQNSLQRIFRDRLSDLVFDFLMVPP